MNFITYSEKQLTPEYLAVRENHILISIQDVGKTVTIPDTVYRKGLLKLEFNDVNGINETHDYFTYAQAEEILQFLEKYADKITCIVVQCHAGISRSVAIASALSKILNNEDDYLFNTGIPNMFVYSTLLETYFCNEVIKHKWSKIWYLRSMSLKQKLPVSLYRLSDYLASKKEKEK